MIKHLKEYIEDITTVPNIDKIKFGSQTTSFDEETKEPQTGRAALEEIIEERKI